VDTPFYCYAYNFGELLSYALYKQYKSEGSGYIKKIINILKSGGSKNPIEVLEEVGIDVNNKLFWQKSFELINEWQTELENL
jgi:oligoendopeptidase F